MFDFLRSYIMEAMRKLYTGFMFGAGRELFLKFQNKYLTM